MSVYYCWMNLKAQSDLSSSFKAKSVQQLLKAEIVEELSLFSVWEHQYPEHDSSQG